MQKWTSLDRYEERKKERQKMRHSSQRWNEKIWGMQKKQLQKDRSTYIGEEERGRDSKKVKH